MKRSNRAAVTVVVIVLLGLLSAGSWAWYKITEPGRNTKVANQAAVAAAVAQTQSVAVKAQADAVQAAVATATQEHAHVIALRDQIDQNTSGFVEGAKIAIQADPAPSEADKAALALLDSAGQALGQPLTPEQRAVWTKTVAGLIAHNAETTAKLAAATADAAQTRAALDATQARANAADAHAHALTGQLQDQATALVAATTESAKKTAENKAWADGAQTLWGRFKALGVLATVLAVAALVIGGKLIGVSGTLKDAVALVEHVKGAAISAGHDAIALEQKISAWWENDKSAQAAFSKVKAKLRL